MSSTTEVAMKFFEACEAGKGWEICKIVRQTHPLNARQSP